MTYGKFTGEFTIHCPFYSQAQIVTNTYETLGLRMGENFIQELTDINTMKAFIENESRIENGKRIIPTSFCEARNLTLTFSLSGKESANMSAEMNMWNRRTLFERILRSGWIGIEIPSMETVNRTVYWLLYQGKGNTYAISPLRDFCVMSLKFIEPNPAHRDATSPPYALQSS